jgi:hypothetical protein
METSGTVTAGDLDRTATYLSDDFTFEGPIAHYRSAEEFLTRSRPFVETLRPGWTVRAVASPRRHTSAVELNPGSERIPTQPGVTLAVG